MLNPDETISLVAEHESTRLLVGFHPQPGNYKVYVPPGITIEEGSCWSFYCPVCHEDLKSELADELCAVDLTSQTETHRVFFSRVAGVHATFVVSAEGLRESHGGDTSRYDEALPHLKYVLFRQ
jgi:hypothetical protein